MVPTCCCCKSGAVVGFRLNVMEGCLVVLSGVSVVVEDTGVVDDWVSSVAGGMGSSRTIFRENFNRLGVDWIPC